MWLGETCAFIQFFFGRLDQIKIQLKQAEKYKKEKENNRIPEHLKKASIEDLANTIFNKYIQENPIKVLTRQTGICTPMRPRLGYRQQYQYLDLQRSYLYRDSEFENKLERATQIVNQRICSKWDEKYKERFEEEKGKIEKISSDVINWAKNLQLKEIKESDLKVYLVENQLNFLKESTTNLLNVVNLGLKESY
jgi:hypothetical protein